MFIVIPTAKDVAGIERTLNETFSQDHYRLPNGEWLVRFDGTSEELSIKLETSAVGVGGRALVFAIEEYFGFAPANVWAWIKARWSGGALRTND
ncbi:hypothetical protein [Pararobbsia alpina]|nr:hypothetical protein [Pararobbsia alpina]